VAEQLSGGSKLAGYRIESVIGRGGMGVVYLATHERLERRVALKLIAPERAADNTFRRRFLRESRLAASIEHPNAVPVYEAGEADDGTVYIAMRYVEGTDLRALLAAEGWLEARRAAGLVAQVAGALDEAHRRGLTHRDVKPANVLIGEVGGEEWAYLSDFGATRRSAGSDITGTGDWLGTVDYASPEQIQGKRVGAGSDIYSLGCVLYEALTGRLPFEREDEVAKLYAHVNDPPPSLTALDPTLPAELDRVVARALAKDPADRYPSAGDLARAAVAAAAGETTAEQERSVATGEARSGVRVDAAPTRTMRPLRPPLLGGPPPWRLVGALAALAVVVAVAGPLVLGGSVPRVVATIDVGGRPLGVAVGPGSVWVTDQESNTLTPLDPDFDRVAGPPIPVGSEPAGVKSGEGFVWVANSGDGTVSRVNQRSGQVLTIPVGRRPVGIRVGEGAVWVTNLAGDSVSKIAPRTLRVERIPVGDGPAGIAVGEGGVWVANTLDGTIARILPASGDLAATIDVGERPRGVAVGEGSVWVANASDDTVTRIDADTSEVVGEPIEVGQGPGQVVVGETWVWVTNEGDNTVSRIDPESGEVVDEPIAVGAAPRAITVGQGSVWVANSGDGTVSRIDD
jgi:DNA-binding beta-propeller fold protein YncE